MLKLMGALLVFLTSSWIGWQLASQYRRRPQEIRQVHTALSLLEMEMVYGNRPLEEICRLIGEREKGVIGEIFRRSAHQLAHDDADDTYRCFQNAIQQVWEQGAMQESERKVLLDLSAVLGRSHRENQIQQIQAAREQMKLEEKKARQEQEQYEKMFRTLGMLAGAMIVILLY